MHAAMPGSWSFYKICVREKFIKFVVVSYLAGKAIKIV